MKSQKNGGKDLGNKIKAGQIDPTKLVKLELPIRTKLDRSNFSATTKIFMAMGLEKAGVAMSGVIVFAGLSTGGKFGCSIHS